MKLDELNLDIDYFEFDEMFYQHVKPTPLLNPKLISYNKKACDLIDLNYKECRSGTFLDFMNGSKFLNGSNPYAMAYAGHQFGYFVPQLGDGRAINLGSVNGWHLQIKGSGITKYSRDGDGRAVLRSSIREYIIGEAMNALNIPTTRALGIIGSDSFAYRGYDKEPCAAVTRMSPSWVRIGTFEFFANKADAKRHVKQLADYVIRQSYPHLINEENRYEKMFASLVDKSATLLAYWQLYGFMHGVMNTDNFSMAGLTIDYGPYAFMDHFRKNCICNHTDTTGRYSFNNQPYIARWNLLILAYSLRELIDEEVTLEYIRVFLPKHEDIYLKLMNERLGIDYLKGENRNLELIKELLGSLEASNMDYNLFFYKLSKLESFDDISSITNIVSFKEPITTWFSSYEKVCKKENSSFVDRNNIMKNVNPKYIIKNYMLGEAIAKSHQGDHSLVDDLLHIAQNPFCEHPNFERYANPTPIKLANLQLSCSS